MRETKEYIFHDSIMVNHRILRRPFPARITKVKHPAFLRFIYFNFPSE